MELDQLSPLAELAGIAVAAMLLVWRRRARGRSDSLAVETPFTLVRILDAMARLSSTVDQVLGEQRQLSRDVHRLAQESERRYEDRIDRMARAWEERDTRLFRTLEEHQKLLNTRRSA